MKKDRTSDKKYKEKTVVRASFGLLSHLVLMVSLITVEAQCCSSLSLDSPHT